MSRAETEGISMPKWHLRATTPRTRSPSWGVKFSFGERNTVYTEVGLDDEMPPPITEGFCRVLRIVITTDDVPPLGAEQAGRYNARVLHCEGTSAVAMMNEVKGVSVTGTNLRNVRRAFRRIMQGSVRPTSSKDPLLVGADLSILGLFCSVRIWRVLVYLWKEAAGRVKRNNDSRAERLLDNLAGAGQKWFELDRNL